MAFCWVELPGCGLAGSCCLRGPGSGVIGRSKSGAAELRHLKNDMFIILRKMKEANYLQVFESIAKEFVKGDIHIFLFVLSCKQKLQLKDWWMQWCDIFEA